MFRPVALAFAMTAVLAAPSPASAQTAPEAGVALAATVYLGSDGGAGCATAATYAEGTQNDIATYCFTVTNTGATHLGQIAVDVPQVADPVTLLGAESVPLAPGHSAHYYVVSTPPPDEADGEIDETFTTTASVSAIALNEASEPVAGAAPVTASAQAVVFPPEIPPAPQVELSTSVYAGHDGGQGCPAADLTLVEQSDPITYCYTVTNVGNTHLASIALDQLELDGTPTLIRAESDPLAPDQSAFYYLETAAPAVGPEGVTANAAATASSVDATGAALIGVDTVTSQDGAEIQPRAQAETPVPVAEPVATPEPPAAPAEASQPAEACQPSEAN